MATVRVPSTTTERFLTVVFPIEIDSRYIRVGRLLECYYAGARGNPTGTLFGVESETSAIGAKEFNLYAFGRCLQVAWGGA